MLFFKKNLNLKSFLFVVQWFWLQTSSLMLVDEWKFIWSLWLITSLQCWIDYHHNGVFALMYVFSTRCQIQVSQGASAHQFFNIFNLLIAVCFDGLELNVEELILSNIIQYSPAAQPHPIWAKWTSSHIYSWFDVIKKCREPSSITPVSEDFFP